MAKRKKQAGTGLQVIRVSSPVARANRFVRRRKGAPATARPTLLVPVIGCALVGAADGRGMLDMIPDLIPGAADSRAATLGLAVLGASMVVTGRMKQHLRSTATGLLSAAAYDYGRNSLGAKK